jgi:hypothetical protein
VDADCAHANFGLFHAPTSLLKPRLRPPRRARPDP